MSILKYILADKERKEELRKGYGDIWRHSNTYNMINNASMIPKVVAGVGGEYISDYSKSAYDGIQNIYGNTLDSMYDNVGNFFGLNGNQYTGYMGNPHDTTGTGYNSDLPEGSRLGLDNFIPKSSDDRVYYQETDTGPGLMTAGGPLSRKGRR